MDLTALKTFYENRCDRRVPLALATVVATKGSTYSKAGALMLIDEHGIFQGMLSGGCLEGDLAIRAQQVIESGRPALVEYDLGMDNEELWGLGVGCDGLMIVLLQPLYARDDYEPIASVVATLDAGDSLVLSTIFQSSCRSASLATSAVYDGQTHRNFGLTDKTAALLAMSAAAAYGERTSRECTESRDGGEFRFLSSYLSPPPMLLVLGAGLDAVPVVRLASELGWRCTVVDHRPAYLEKGDFALAHDVVGSELDAVADTVALNDFDAAIVMSHHLASDRAYLQMLANSDVGYVGLLGPVGRRDRLLQEIGDAAALLGDRLHGPAGIDIGGRGPAPIALSIVAGIQAYLATSAA